MSLFQIEPRDPLCFTDGRGTQGAALRTLSFPWPSTLAGLVRARAGSDRDGRFIHRRLDDLRRVGVRGPWLLRWSDESGGPPDWFVPAPRDGVWMQPGAPAPGGPLRFLPLAPADLPTGYRSSLPGGLRPVGLKGEPVVGKPHSGPAFWSWAQLTRWLIAPGELELPADEVKQREDFLGQIPVERRTHVAIEPDGTTAIDGALFESHGLRFAVPSRRASQGGALLSEQRLGLGFLCDEGKVDGTAPLAERGGPVVLGGERRVAFLRPQTGQVPACPEAVTRHPGREFRVILLTPAIFAEGAVPTAIHGAPVVAAVVGRPEVVSGWDMEKRAPKPTRRMAPAGSVYWVKLPDGTTPSAWLEEVWMTCISSDEQDRRDGFGLVVVGVGS